MSELLVGLDYAESALDESYYDSVYGCPGLLHSLDTEEQLQGHFEPVHKYFEKAIRFFPDEKTTFTRELLWKLTPRRVKLGETEMCSDSPFKHAPNNLLLPFMEEPDTDE